METGVMESQQVSSDPFSFARSYRLEALEKAINQNTIVFLETGSGKTLIAIMLLRNYAYLLQKPTPFIAIFLVPKVVLVTQQAEVVEMHTNKMSSRSSSWPPKPGQPSLALNINVGLFSCNVPARLVVLR